MTQQQTIGNIGLAAHLLTKCGDGVIAMSVHPHGAVRVKVQLMRDQFLEMFPAPVGTVEASISGEKWLVQRTGQIEYFCRHVEEAAA